MYKNIFINEKITNEEILFADVHTVTEKNTIWKRNEIINLIP